MPGLTKNKEKYAEAVSKVLKPGNHGVTERLVII
jgi:hypothetical protein